MSEYEHMQDIFGNLPMIKRYTLLSIFFDIDTNINTDVYDVTIHQGLHQLGDTVPWLKGQVVYEGQTSNNWGRRKVISFENRILLKRKDLSTSDSVLRMKEMSEQGFPIRYLDPSIFVPEGQLPRDYTATGYYEESPERPARVLVVQATYLRDGLVLTFCSNHTTMDMHGLGQVICLFAKACRNEMFTTIEVEDANQSRAGAIPTLGNEYAPGSEKKYFDFTTNQAADIPAPSDAFWANVSFTPDSLKKLKAKASEQALVPYISTNDALSAFFWQRITAARAPRLGTMIETELNRQTSARHLFGLPASYLGHCVASAHTHEVDVYNQPLGTVTAKLRQTLSDKDTIKFHFQAMRTMLDRPSIDNKTIGNGASLTEKDVILSSHAEIGVCQVSYGMLGQPLAARRPNINPAAGLVYLMPKDRDGSQTAVVCLTRVDMLRMQEAEEFKKHAFYVG